MPTNDLGKNKGMVGAGHLFEVVGLLLQLDFQMLELIDQLKCAAHYKGEQRSSLLNSIANQFTKERSIEEFVEQWMRQTEDDSDPLAAELLSRTGVILQSYIWHHVLRGNSGSIYIERNGFLSDCPVRSLAMYVQALGLSHETVGAGSMLRYFVAVNNRRIQILCLDTLVTMNSAFARSIIEEVAAAHFDEMTREYAANLSKGL